MIAALPEAARIAVVAAFTRSYHYVYLAAATLCALGFVLAFFLKELPLRSRLPVPAARAPADPGD